MSRQEYYQKNKEEIKRKSRDYYYKNRETLLAHQRLRRKENPRMVMDQNRKSRFGITIEEYEKRFSEQGMKCKICDIRLELGKNTHLDHCHETGVVRDFLCVDCNLGLGRFKDSPILLTKARDYLARRWGKR
jgi:hypothetical protein